MDNIFVNTRSSIKITGTKTIYFEPLDIEGTPHDADRIFITHEHYDHFSPDDIKKVLKKDTQIIVPLVMLDMIKENKFPVQSCHGIHPLQTKNYDGVKCQGIPAYNIDKTFHPKSNNWLGYQVELDGKTYYAMGDTDATLEAAEFINKKQPGLVVPIHYGASEVGENFNKLLRDEIEVHLFLS